MPIPARSNTKWRKRLRGAVGIVAAVIAVAVVTGSILHATVFRNAWKQIEPYGQLVDVEDGRMHVHRVGNGARTIVLLPGLGVGLPSADFGPLMRRLSETYTVATVDYFGVGFSTETSRPRTARNYVEETRVALQRAGLDAPYVLMPHSISSVYSEYFAASYPEEVEAVVSLDGTTTAHYEEMPSIVKALLPIAKIQQAIGATSLIAPLAIDRAKLLANGYTEKEISDMIVFAGFALNDTVLEQIANSAEFIEQTMGMPFPDSIPYFKVISRQTYETSNAQLENANMTPQEYHQQHLERIGEHAQFEVLDGTHFIYHDNVGRIAEITDQLLLGVKR